MSKPSQLIILQHQPDQFYPKQQTYKVATNNAITVPVNFSQFCKMTSVNKDHDCCFCSWLKENAWVINGLINLISIFTSFGSIFPIKVLGLCEFVRDCWPFWDNSRKQWGNVTLNSQVDYYWIKSWTFINPDNWIQFLITSGVRKGRIAISLDSQIRQCIA